MPLGSPPSPRIRVGDETPVFRRLRAQRLHVLPSTTRQAEERCEEGTDCRLQAHIVTHRKDGPIKLPLYQLCRNLRVTHGAVVFAAAFQILVGLGAIVLAVLALIGFTPLVLSLVALLALGSASVLSGASVATRMLGATPLRRWASPFP